MGDQRLGLADVQAVLQDALGGELLVLFAGQAENDLGVADREPAVAEVALDSGRQFEQAQGIGHHGAALADLGGDFLLRELELLDELRVALGFLDRVEVLALQIFDERQFEHRAVVGLADDDGDFRQAEQLGGAPAAFAGDQFEMAVAFADDERLDDALFLDGIGQFAQGLGRKNPCAAGRGRARTRSSGTRWTRSRGSAAGAGSGTVVGTAAGTGGLAMGLPPNNAPRPRPKAGFAMRPECRRPAGSQCCQW